MMKNDAPKLDYGDLIGKPFQDFGRGPEGFDCYGLWIEVSRRLGQQIPDFGSVAADLVKAVAGKITAHKQLFMRVNEPQTGDAVLIESEPGVGNHIGVVVAPGLFLHAMQGAGVHRSRLDHPLWRNRIEGFYRFVT